MIKQFNGLNIEVHGTYEEPLFKAKDIGDLLGIKNIRDTISSFNEKQKGVSLTDTPGGQQEVTFLTEQGLYKVLMRSRKKVAEQFQDWVCEVIKEIRLKGKYELEEKLQEQQHLLEEQEDVLTNLKRKEVIYQSSIKHREELLKKYKNKKYEEIEKNGHIYILSTDGGNKVGKTKDVFNRIKSLQTSLNFVS